MLIDPVNHVIINYGEFKQGEASVDRVIELLEIEPAVRELPPLPTSPRSQGELSIAMSPLAMRPQNRC
jgi:ATP-binding cassette subfamily B protein